VIHATSVQCSGGDLTHRVPYGEDHITRPVATSARADTGVMTFTTSRLDGRGVLVLGDEILLASVAYHLLLWEQEGALAVQFDGWIEASAQIARRMMLCPTPSTLILADGRALHVRMLDVRGRFSTHAPTVRGHSNCGADAGEDHPVAVHSLKGLS
jgi:hypothetical protein